MLRNSQGTDPTAFILERKNIPGQYAILMPSAASGLVRTGEALVHAGGSFDHLQGFWTTPHGAVFHVYSHDNLNGIRTNTFDAAWNHINVNTNAKIAISMAVRYPGSMIRG